MAINFCLQHDAKNGTNSGVLKDLQSVYTIASKQGVTSSEVLDNQPYINILPNDINIFRNINISEKTIPSELQRDIITRFIAVFQNLILKNRMILQNSGNFPPLVLQNLHDGSVLIEWIYPDFRIGFSFESNIKESSWYLVSNKHLKEVSSSGLLDISEVEGLLIYLLHFIISNI